MNLDLSAAITAVLDVNLDGDDLFVGLAGDSPYSLGATNALAIVEAVAPQIEQAVRERVAREIETAMVSFPSSALALAAQIARTGAAPTPAVRWHP